MTSLASWSQFPEISLISSLVSVFEGHMLPSTIGRSNRNRHGDPGPQQGWEEARSHHTAGAQEKLQKKSM